jgi:amidase
VRPFREEVGADPGRLRIAVVDTAPLGLPTDPECATAVRATADLLAGLGHELVDEVIEIPDAALTAFLNMVNSGLADYDGVDWSATEPHIQANRAAAQGVDSLTYVAAIHHLQLYSRDVVARWGRDFDVLLTPTLAILPPPVGVLDEVHASAGAPALTVFQMAVFNAFFNVTGQPSISLPLAMSQSGLPIGLQFVAGPWREDLLIRLASQLETAAPWSDRCPALLG